MCQGLCTCFRRAIPPPDVLTGSLHGKFPDAPDFQPYPNDPQDLMLNESDLPLLHATSRSSSSLKSIDEASTDNTPATFQSNSISSEDAATRNNCQWWSQDEILHKWDQNIGDAGGAALSPHTSASGCLVTDIKPSPATATRATASCNSCIDPTLLSLDSAACSKAEERLYYSVDSVEIAPRCSQFSTLSAQQCTSEGAQGTRRYTRVAVPTIQNLLNARSIPMPPKIRQLHSIFAAWRPSKALSRQKLRALATMVDLHPKVVRDWLIKFSNCGSSSEPEATTHVRCLRSSKGVPIEPRPRNPKKPFPCLSGCEYTFSKLIDWKRHMAINWLKSYWRCPESPCDAKFSGMRCDLLYGQGRHLQRTHSRFGVLPDKERDYYHDESDDLFQKRCGFCGVLYNSFDIFMKHVGAHFNDNQAEPPNDMQNWRNDWEEDEMAGVVDDSDDDFDEDDSNERGEDGDPDFGDADKNNGEQNEKGDAGGDHLPSESGADDYQDPDCGSEQEPPQDHSGTYFSGATPGRSLYAVLVWSQGFDHRSPGKAMSQRDANTRVAQDCESVQTGLSSGVNASVYNPRNQIQPLRPGIPLAGAGAGTINAGICFADADGKMHNVQTTLHVVSQPSFDAIRQLFAKGDKDEHVTAKVQDYFTSMRKADLAITYIPITLDKFQDSLEKLPSWVPDFSPVTASNIFTVNSWPTSRLRNVKHDKIPSEIKYDGDEQPISWGIEARSDKKIALNWFKILLDEKHMQDLMENENLPTRKQRMALIHKQAAEYLMRDYLRGLWEIAFENVQVSPQKYSKSALEDPKIQHQRHQKFLNDVEVILQWYTNAEKVQPSPGEVLHELSAYMRRALDPKNGIIWTGPLHADLSDMATEVRACWQLTSDSKIQKSSLHESLTGSESKRAVRYVLTDQHRALMGYVVLTSMSAAADNPKHQKMWLQRAHIKLRVLCAAQDPMLLMTTHMIFVWLQEHDPGQIAESLIKALCEVATDALGRENSIVVLLEWMTAAAGKRLANSCINSDILCRAAGDFRERLGSKHPHTLVALYYMCFHMLGVDHKLAEAEDELRKLYQTTSTSLGRSNLLAVCVMATLSRAQSRQAKYREALESINRSIQEAPLGLNHPHRLHLSLRKALVCWKLKDMRNADEAARLYWGKEVEKLYWIVFKGRAATLGRYHKLTESSCDTLIEILKENGRWDLMKREVDEVFTNSGVVLKYGESFWRKIVDKDRKRVGAEVME